MPDAPGLPDRKRFTPIRTIPKGTNAIFPLVMHRHNADRAGLHYDLRLGDQVTGVAHSWAYRSGKLPRVGERIEVHQQPDHTLPYMSFKGKIEEGYGKGRVGIARSGSVEVLDSTPEKLHFRLGRKRFVLVKTPRYSERSWLLIGLPAQKRQKTAMHMVPSPVLADELLKAAAEATDPESTRDRTIGHGLGSAASNLVTGYALAPVLYPKKSPFEKVHPKALKGMVSGAEYGKEMARRGQGFFKKHYGTRALVPALALTGGAFIGGAMKENIQAGYERWSEKRREKKADLQQRAYPGCSKCIFEPMDHCSKCRQHVSTDWKTGWCASCEAKEHHQRVSTRFGKAAEVLEGFIHAVETGKLGKMPGNSGESRTKVATGLLLYTGNPSERPSAPKPGKAKGFAAHFGNRFNPSAIEHRHAERGADEWMSGSSEFVDLGRRPNLVQAAREVLQIEPGKPISRAQALQMVREKAKVRSGAVTRRRAGVLKGMEEAADSPEDIKELIEALETVTKHPRVRYIELTEKG